MADNGGIVVVVVVVEGLRGRGARKRFTLGTPTRAGFATRHNGTRPINRLWPRFIVLAWVRCQEITARWKHARGEPRLPPSCRFLLLRYSLRFLFLRLFFFFFYWFSRSVEGRWADAIVDWVFDFLELVCKM